MPGKGEPVPRHKRNPRWAYDVKGREITPATIANSWLNGARGIMVLCKYGHEATLPFDGLADTLFVPGVALSAGARRASRRCQISAGGRQDKRLKRKSPARQDGGRAWQQRKGDATKNDGFFDLGIAPPQALT